MTFNDYQMATEETADYPSFQVIPKGEECGIIRVGFIYPALGLAGESGEVLEKVKKICRDQRGWLDPGDRELLSKELGDVLWYIAQLADKLDLSLEDIAKQNLEKLLSRKQRGVLHGSGDER